ncbi:MAG: serine/threonine-protein kinase [Planctomycetota bacterium]
MKRNSPSSGRAPESGLRLQDSPLGPLDGGDDAWLELVRVAETPRAGGRVGDYEILGEVRGGAQGLVYRARQLTTGREVALKRLAAGSFSTDREERRFEREVEAVAGLDHPGIVTLYGVEVVDGVKILAMEWVQGCTLTEWAAAREPGRRGTIEKLGVFLQLCDAVQHAHQRGVLHRDLKPSNVLIDERGRCRVLDFGLARRLPSDARGADPTLTVGFVGTPAYSAPERFADDHASLDVRSDVYALGVMLYEMLTGRRPFGGSGLRELLEQIDRQAVPAPSTLAPGGHRELDGIAAMALAPRPEARYQSVHALADDVRRALDGRPITAVPPSRLGVISKWIRRHRVVFSFSLALLLSLAGAAVLGVWQATVIAAERDTARRQRALALQQADLAREVQDFYYDSVVRAASPWADQPGANLLQVLQDAVPVAVERFREHPAVAAELIDGVAQVFVARARYAEGLQLCEQALALCDRVGPTGVELRANVTNTHADALFKSGDVVSAIEAGRRAVALYESLDAPPRQLFAAALNSVAGYLKRGNDFAAAEGQLRRACGLVEGAGNRTEWMVKSHFGEVLVLTEKYDEAEAVLLATLRTAEASAASTPLVVGHLHGSVAMLYRAKGEAARAIPHQRRSVAVAAAILGPTDFMVASERTVLGRCLRDVGQLREAAAEFAAAAAMGHPPLTASARRQQAKCFQALGELDRAVELMATACDDAVRDLPASRGLRGAAFVDWLALLVEAGQADRARELVPRVLDEAEPHLDGDRFAEYRDRLRECGEQLGSEVIEARLGGGPAAVSAPAVEDG